MHTSTPYFLLENGIVTLAGWKVVNNAVIIKASPCGTETTRDEKSLTGKVQLLQSNHETTASKCLCMKSSVGGWPYTCSQSSPRPVWQLSGRRGTRRCPCGGSSSQNLTRERIKQRVLRWPPVHPSSPCDVNLPCVGYLFTDCCWFRILLVSHSGPLPSVPSSVFKYSKQQYLIISYCWIIIIFS